MWYIRKGNAESRRAVSQVSAALNASPLASDCSGSPLFVRYMYGSLLVFVPVFITALLPP
ncbi:hypothetical protein M430DRAFT_37313 [Amorphotheca resinae ATCC 22711]|jgi:hypothetical protein|uniref:Uncharacterized protein n=1 Tax=Amorphotheca resinae ATCC 22711 TaxID=857342 RepID=A0A2T3ASI8_AMORE|nr:hypothetical protein M430DRAFT_37313 [Amorphotheca resinae ATCC 22711]PSS09324.1 hypothetical protein M430DRAFT_37313 [Amorphotheca resinae ATCC 22711]